MRSMISVLLALVAVACIGSSPFAPGPRPTVSQVEPSPAAVGDAVTVTGSGFASTGNALKIGAGYVLNLPSADSTSIHLTLPAYLGVCAPGQEVCPAIVFSLVPGDYKLSVITANGTSNEVSLRVIAK